MICYIITYNRHLPFLCMQILQATYNRNLPFLKVRAFVLLSFLSILLCFFFPLCLLPNSLPLILVPTWPIFSSLITEIKLLLWQWQIRPFLFGHKLWRYSVFLFYLFFPFPPLHIRLRDNFGVLLRDLLIVSLIYLWSFSSLWCIEFC